MCNALRILVSKYSKFGYYIDGIYPIEFEIKETAGAARSASYLDQNLEIDRWLEEMISIFSLWTFRLNVATFQQYLNNYGIHISQYDIPEIVVTIWILLIKGCC